ncbi:MAG: MarR family winged helix-turn-helix transcriptional regulator [archaeon]|nr:MarR family winged helix-turn-helix transcriptional regulator [archaeon]
MENKKIKDIDSSEIPIGKLVSIISRSYGIYLNRHLEGLNLRGLQIPVLLEIHKRKTTSQSDIASDYCIDKGAVSRALRKLEDEKYILRTIDTTNRRRNIVSLTEKGNKTIHEICTIFEKWESEIYKDIDLKEKEALQKSLKIIALKSIEINNE